jgi:hypothetical protein
MTFEEYINDAKSQLYCNASEDYRSNYITYNYTNEDIDNNLTYFKSCFNKSLSAYKALLYLSDEKN